VSGVDKQQLWDQVRSQAVVTPAIYGTVDFDAVPERFAGAAGEPNELRTVSEAERAQLLADDRLMTLIRAYTVMGDRVADPYAALMPEYGFKRLIEMLEQACRHGIASVADAPPELRSFIAAMETVPDWLDMAMVEEGARIERAPMAIMSPIAIRAAFIATFMNRYSALPMALTGTLSNASAARRIKETATFFATSVLPGALARDGEGFRAAAMVRLMHSMVRFNAMRKGRWDVSIYGIPIPQVDQMPAGLIGVTMMAAGVLREGRSEFTAQERARVELSRYRCYLLGLPEALLGTTPKEIVTLMAASLATLRSGFDDETCGNLLRATLGAYLPADNSPASRVFDRVEKGFSKVFFVKNYAGGDKAKAASMGVVPDALDKLCYGIAAAVAGSRLLTYQFAMNIPMLAAAVDRRLVAIIGKQLADWGHAHFTTDASAYRLTAPSAAAPVPGEPAGDQREPAAATRSPT
jgi:hypothetical protein